MKIREKNISFVTYMTLKTIVNKTSSLNLKELNHGIVFDITDGDSSAVLVSEREFRFTTALCKELQSLVEQVYTINFELTLPRNRIVLSYEVD
jgi:hypothetical protein